MLTIHAMSEEPKPRWLLAGITLAVLAASFVMLAIPALRIVGGIILGGYFLLVEFALHRSIYEDASRRKLKKQEKRTSPEDWT